MKQRERRLEEAKKSSSSTTKCKAHVKQRRNARGGRQTLRSQLKERETEGAAPHSQSESAHAHKRKGICRRNKETKGGHFFGFAVDEVFNK